MFRRIQSIRENLSIKDLILTGAPTAGTYTGYLNGYLNNVLPDWLVDNPYLALSITLLIFLIILTIIYMVNNEASKKSLGEVLATGYYLNFSGKLTSLLRRESDITFIRSSGSMTVHPKNVKLEVILPTSARKLGELGLDVQKGTEIAYIDPEPFADPSWWLKIKVDGENQKVRILEFPRTLFALPHYLSGEYSHSASKKIHKAFNKKFQQLIRDNPDKRPPEERFEIVVD